MAAVPSDGLTRGVLSGHLSSCEPMAKTYSQIQEQIASLQSKANAVRQKEIAGVVKRINMAIRHYGITSADLDFPSSAPKPTSTKGKSKPDGKAAAKTRSKSAGRKVAPKYRDDKGNTWAARGSQPRWLRDAIANGASLESFAVR
jgi:DNA-binding protein H-NS